MTYNSLLDLIPREEGNPLFSNGISGEITKVAKNGISLEEVIDRLRTLIGSSESNESDIVEIVLYTGTLINTVIDARNISEQRHLEFLKKTINTGINIFKQESGIEMCVDEIMRELKEYGQDLSQPAKFPDHYTSLAMDPIRSNATADQLAKETKFGENILFIALAYGGTIPGMDTYLRYCDKNHSTDSSFYVARFSRRKRGDTTPVLSSAEIRYLNQLAEKSSAVVVFDEDTSSGKSLLGAHQFLSKVLVSKPFLLATNRNSEGFPEVQYKAAKK